MGSEVQVGVSWILVFGPVAWQHMEEGTVEAVALLMATEKQREVVLGPQVPLMAQLQ